MKSIKPIHLLYVPTMFCNMGCSYCYLGSQTDQVLAKTEQSKIVETLEIVLKNITKSNHLAFNVSLHGGEVTTLPINVLEKLFQIINQHYTNNFDALNKFGFKKTVPHLKTNLYNFNRLYDLFNKHRVSVSASIDLPLFLHDKYRTTKAGKSTLNKTLDNLRLLANYPHKKKVSAVIYDEHIENLDQLIEDVWYLHNEIGFNMNNFNFMFGFESGLNEIKFEDNLLNTKAVSDINQVKFYNALKKEFFGTELEEGFKGNWFDEFKPSYCTNALNCGEKFYLLQADGSVHSCVRGQGVESFEYGNALNEPFEEIVKNGSHKIKLVHQKYEFHDDCKSCEYLYLCNTGCAFVKNEQKKGKSYTCLLQKEIYKDNPISYPPLKEKTSKKQYILEYTKTIHPKEFSKITKDDDIDNNRFIVPNDAYDEKNELIKIIASDKNLGILFSTKMIKLKIDEEIFELESPITKKNRELFYLNKDSKISLQIDKQFFNANCKETIRNTLYLQMLRDTKVVYGDEEREKQEHLFTNQIFYKLLKIKGQFIEFNLSPLFIMNSDFFLPKVLNNFFITTNDLRNYHYKKQKSNAFYHIQAINLPFPNFEFYWEN